MKRITLLLLLVMLVATGCSSQGTTASLALPATDMLIASATPAATGTATPAHTHPATATLTPAPTAFPTLETFPVVSFVNNTNCRTGPGVRYYALLTYPQGATAQANGRNQDGSWISVRVPNQSNYCWVAVSTVNPFGNVATLRLIEAQTLPDTPATITISRDLCGIPNIVMIDWTQVGSARGYRIYRNGQLMQTNNGVDNHYYDNPKLKKPTVFAVEAFNEYGVSNRIAITVPACK
jgi:uncharacterized protein YraI